MSSAAELAVANGRYASQRATDLMPEEPLHLPSRPRAHPGAHCLQELDNLIYFLEYADQGFLPAIVNANVLPLVALAQARSIRKALKKLKRVRTAAGGLTAEEFQPVINDYRGLVTQIFRTPQCRELSSTSTPSQLFPGPHSHTDLTVLVSF